MGAQFSNLLPDFSERLIKQNVPKHENDSFLHSPALSAELIA
jgi:hypothetical protein